MTPNGIVPTEVLEGYSSMIWTERYADHGEFQLKTPRIKEHLAQMTYFSIGRMITHKDTDVVMMADNYSIETNEDGVEELTVTGRTVTSIFEDRAVEGLRGEPWKPTTQYNAVDYIGALIWDALGLGYNLDPINNNPVLSDIFEIPQAAHISGYCLTNTIHRDLIAAQDWFITAGEVWKKITDALTLDRLGIRVIRPPWNAADVPGGTPTYEMTYDPPGGTDTGGAATYLGVGGFETDDRLQINIYTGIERPNTIFNWDRGDISTAKYLISDKNYKNVCYVQSNTTAYDNIWVYADGASDTTSIGFARRAMAIDGETDQGSLSGPDYEALLRQKGEIELKKHRRDRMLDAAIAINTPYKYKIDYDLGDTVTVMGDHGFFETMMVSEHIRTDDAEGDREYPTLIRNEVVETE